jgi:hypothetical protein
MIIQSIQDDVTFPEVTVTAERDISYLGVIIFGVVLFVSIITEI